MVDMKCELNIQKILNYLTIAELQKRKAFPCVLLKFVEPKTTASIFRTGKMMCTGSKSEEDSKLAARKSALLLQKLGFEVRKIFSNTVFTTLFKDIYTLQVKFKGFKIVNVVASCDVNFRVNLVDLHLKLKDSRVCSTSFEPEIFPCLVCRMCSPKATALIYQNGKIVLTGAKSGNETEEVFQKLFPIPRGSKSTPE